MKKEPPLILLTCFRVFAVPALVALYLLPLPFLVTRDSMHRIVYFLDYAFDHVAKLAGWDSRYWPLPKASEAPLPYSEDF